MELIDPLVSLVGPLSVVGRAFVVRWDKCCYQIGGRGGGRGRLRVRVFRTEHAHKVWRPTFFEVRVLRTENSYS